MWQPYGFRDTGASLSKAQIARRTLPGRTVISGHALPDVVSVTLRTPTDVRTLAPAGRHHLLISVYDGLFYRGHVTITARFRDGHTWTETRPAALF
jgi:hypothetical protein